MAQWKAELCGCFDDIPTCLIGYCVPCWLFGTNAEQIDGSNKITMCLGYALLGYCGLGCLLHKPKREKLRNTYGLEEKPNDFLVTCCCPCCGLVQESREMTLRGVQPGGHIPQTHQPR